MSRAVRLLRLRVENVGTLRGPIEIGPFASGINVISGSNEAGKSTLVEALKIGPFERHATKNKGVMALQPHGTKLAPEVRMVLDLEGEQIDVVKRFIEEPMSELRLSNGAIFKANEADEYLRAKLEGKAPKQSGLSREDMGVWGLLCVTQDESAHEDPGDRLDEEVRGALADAVSRQVGQEDFGQLSGGTREQLSVIVRIALARVFAKDRRPPPLILDDTMGWTDDVRFVSMVKILLDAAKGLQIILLTCHGTRFDRLQPDFRVDLNELRRNAVAGIFDPEEPLQ